MAYQPPQPRPQQQVHRAAPAVDTAPAPPTTLLKAVHSPEEWILFSPQSADSRTATSQTPRTTNLSRISDFGSLATDNQDQLDHLDDDQELDCLDDGLHAFNPPLDQSGTVLPSHDGLGAFPPTLATHPNHNVQRQLWQHERYNPSPQYRGRTSDAPDHALTPQDEQRLRIEQWRQEQSRAVMEEIEREARRRRRRAATKASIASSRTVTSKRHIASASDSRQDDTHHSESFWHRITRRVINDLIGLDQATLQVIFGHDFLHDSPHDHNDQVSSSDATMSWERKLLSRIAHELGILVDQISTDSTRAFSTYTKADAQDHTSSSEAAATQDSSPRSKTENAEPVFNPTLGPAVTPSTPHQALWGIEQESAEVEQNSAQYNEDYWERDPSIRMIFSYLVNRFSSRPCSPSRYSTHPQPISQNTDDVAGPLPAAWANPNPEASDKEGTRRVDLIRKNHPLVLQSTQRRRETLLRRHLLQHQQTLKTQGSPLHQHLHHQHHRRTTSSSCASQSTNKRSKRSSAATSLSRNYWDFPSGATGAGSEVSVGSGQAAGTWANV